MPGYRPGWRGLGETLIRRDELRDRPKAQPAHWILYAAKRRDFGAEVGERANPLGQVGREVSTCTCPESW